MTGLPADIRHKVLSKQNVSSHTLTGSVDYLAALKVVKGIMETEEMVENFFVRSERQTEISDLASSLNEAKPSVIRAQLKVPDAAEKDRQRDDPIDIRSTH
jgi:hypothetical protein